MEIKNKFVTTALEAEIALAFKERRSVGVILEDHKFEGTEESLEELLKVFVKHIGPRMTLELIFSANVKIWDNYRDKIGATQWRNVAEESEFKAPNYLLLGESLFQRGEKELGNEFLAMAVETAEEKDYADIAYVIKNELEDIDWATEVLMMAEESANTSDEYLTLGQSIIELTGDASEGTMLFEKAEELAVLSHEYSGLATAVLRVLSDKKWAEELFEKRKKATPSGDPLDMLADEEYQEELAKLS